MNRLVVGLFLMAFAVFARPLDGFGFLDQMFGLLADILYTALFGVGVYLFISSAPEGSPDRKKQ